MKKVCFWVLCSLMLAVTSVSCLFGATAAVAEVPAVTEIEVMGTNSDNWTGALGDWFTTYEGAPTGKPQGAIVKPFYPEWSYAGCAIDGSALGEDIAVSAWVNISDVTKLAKWESWFYGTNSANFMFSSYQYGSKFGGVPFADFKATLQNGWNRVQFKLASNDFSTLVQNNTLMNTFGYRLLDEANGAIKFEVYDIKLVKADATDKGVEVKENIATTNLVAANLLPANKTLRKGAMTNWTDYGHREVTEGLPENRKGASQRAANFGATTTMAYAGIAENNAIDATIINDITDENRAISFWVKIDKDTFTDSKILNEEISIAMVNGNAWMLDGISPLFAANGALNGSSLASKLNIGWNYVVVKTAQGRIANGGLDTQWNKLTGVSVGFKNNKEGGNVEIFDVKIIKDSSADVYTVIPEKAVVNSVSAGDINFTKVKNEFNAIVTKETTTLTLLSNINTASAAKKYTIVGTTGSVTNEGVVTLGEKGSTTKVKLTLTVPMGGVSEQIICITRRTDVNTNLASITLDDVAISDFAPNVKAYTFDRAYTATTVKLLAVAEDATNATLEYKVDNGSFIALSAAVTIDLNAAKPLEATNTVVVVKVANGVEINEYTFTFVVAKIPSSVNTLSAISVGGQAITLVDGTVAYTVDLAAENKFIDLSATTTDTFASSAWHDADNNVITSIIIPKAGLSKVVTNTVMAEDGSAKIYTITINRANFTEDISVSGTEDISINGSYSPDWTTVSNIVPIGKQGQSGKPKFWNTIQFEDSYGLKNPMNIDYFGNDTAVSFWLFLSNVEKITKLDFWVWDAGAVLNLTYDITSIKSELVVGWNKISVKLAAPTTSLVEPTNSNIHFLESTNLSAVKSIGYRIVTSGVTPDMTAYIYDLKVGKNTTQATDFAVLEKQVAGESEITASDFTIELSQNLTQVLGALEPINLEVKINNAMVNQNPTVVWTIKKDAETVATVNGVKTTFTPIAVGEYYITVKVATLADNILTDKIIVNYRAIKAGDILLVEPTEENVEVGKGTTTTFTLEINSQVIPSSADEIKWYLDGELIDGANGLVYDFIATSAGIFELQAKYNETVFADATIITVTAVYPTITAENKDVTLVENQTEIDLTSMFSIANGDYQASDYTVTVKYNGNALPGNKLTVQNIDKVYVIVIVITSDSFEATTKSFNLTVKAFVPAPKTGCGSVMNTNGGIALGIIALALCVGCIALRKKKTNI